MIIVKGNLFDTKDNCIAHCISADMKLKAGIAVEVKKRYPLLPDYCYVGQAYGFYNGPMLVFHLVTKDKYYYKPTYSSLKKSLKSMRSQLGNIKNISIPKIACGLDGLDWNRVKEIIEEVFEGLNVTVYEL